jgi:hypothetical protein
MAITTRDAKFPLSSDYFSGGSGVPTGELARLVNNVEVRVDEIAAGGYLPAGYRSSDGTVTVAVTDGIIGCDTSSAGVTVNLPAVADVPAGYRLYVKDEAGSAGANPITIVPDGSEELDGAASSRTLNTNGDQALVYSTGTAWFSLI